MWVLGMAIFCVAVAVSAFHSASAYDVFLDETIYSRISAGVAVDGRLVFGAYPFFLHGPLSFYLQGGLVSLFGLSGTAIQVLDWLRLSNALAAGVIAVALFAIVARTSSRWTAVVAASLFIFDPFINSYNSRAFIEPVASMWVVLGYRFMLSVVSGGGSPSRSLGPGNVSGPRADWPGRLGALGAKLGPSAGSSPYMLGFIFGLALLSKETSVELYTLTLLWCLLRDWPVPRRFAWRTLIAMGCTYAPYPIIVCATGGAQQFVLQKFGGIERMLGILQVTGFNRPGAPTLISRLTADLHTFLITYALIGLASIGVVFLYRKGNRQERMVAVWGASAFVMMAFQIAQGTLEEQMFYYLVVPSIVVVSCSAHRLLRSWRRRTAFVVGLRVLILLVATFDLATYVQVHEAKDAGISHTVSWIEMNVPARSRVAPLVDGIQYLLPDYSLLFNPEAGEVTGHQLRAADTQIAITSSLQADQGYSAASPRLLNWLRAHARRIFTTTGAAVGTMTVWRLARHLPGDAPPGPELLRPRAPISIGAPTFGHIDVQSGD